MTLDEAKQVLRKNWEQGIECPCCGQFVKRYRRKLTKSMAIGLLSLYKQVDTPGKYIHIKQVEAVNGGEFAQLKRWGLVHDESNEDDHKRTSGMWTITDEGREFVKGNSNAPMYCYTYNGKTLEFSERLTSFRDALGDRFNYREMMDLL